MYAKGAWRPRTGLMNKTEARYAGQLELLKRTGQILWYRYEAIKLKLADKTFLTPDFFVMLPDGTLEIREVKGAKAIYQDDAKVKAKVVAEMYPFRFVVVYPTKGGGWLEEVV